VAATVDALAVVRAAIAGGQVERVRSALARLFDHFTIAEAREGIDAAALASEAIDLDAARKHIRGTLSAAERKAGRTVAQANAAAHEAEAGLGADPAPGSTSADDVLSVGGYVLIPEPRREALMAVGEDGRRAFDRQPLPITTANVNGLPS
jgi:hypothetical protein